MYPLIDRQATGRRIRQIMDEKCVTIKDMQEFLGLACVQSIYHWIDGTSLPSLDNLYAISELLQVSMDALICGNRKPFIMKASVARDRRLMTYYSKMKRLIVA